MSVVDKKQMVQKGYSKADVGKDVMQAIKEIYAARR